jgi:ribosomal protein S18 acetylase RimI-like enzyme
MQAEIHTSKKVNYAALCKTGQAIQEMISIRRIDPREASVLTRIALAAKAYWGYPERWMEIWKPVLTFSPEYFEINENWTAIIAETLIGFYTLEDRNGNAWLENLWVLPEYIGKGVGQALFHHATERSRQRGYRILQLEADPNAVGFYEKMGMYKIGERRSEVDGQPRVLPIMEMRLEK